MTRVEKIEKDIEELSPGELASLRGWFDRFDAEVWDREFEKDARSGKLDQLAEEALAQHRAGESREL